MSGISSFYPQFLRKLRTTQSVTGHIGLDGSAILLKIHPLYNGNGGEDNRIYRVSGNMQVVFRKKTRDLLLLLQ